MTNIAPVLIADPTGDLVSLDRAKAHLRVTGDDEDDLIGGLISAVGDFLEGWSGWLGRCIRPQTWRTSLPGFYGANLPFPNARTATVTYFPAVGTEQTLDPQHYTIVNRVAGSLILFDADGALPSVADREDAVRIDVEYGLDVIPSSVSTAACMLIGYWYENRQGDKDMPPAVASLLSPLRVVGV